jgi:alkylation response protein AidB-like acyl-CoA dehydrogenase
MAPLPDDASLRTRLTPGSRFIHQFARRRAELETAFPRLARALADDGILWISWPKKASGVETDLTEDVLRELGLPLGLVDVKVCAVDDVWSGLKFVRRKENRR